MESAWRRQHLRSGRPFPGGPVIGPDPQTHRSGTPRLLSRQLCHCLVNNSRARVGRRALPGLPEGGVQAPWLKTSGNSSPRVSDSHECSLRPLYTCGTHSSPSRCPTPPCLGDRTTVSCRVAVSLRELEESRTSLWHASSRLCLT